MGWFWFDVVGILVILTVVYLLVVGAERHR
ncbi:hypothetical protein FB388_2166 [Pseudonocardia cypriaca]|jgi:hypothetical protein|uniref:Uncharacterized protein n=1 Tax=Pseudonocardia cypriaca TaxID=882449 RepID=A0A543GFD8_9PSEU|nr:hypothetical protein FB388_2166 [Pseudonocardia cypriaca]